MPQEFLASFAVDIDEAGVSRLQAVLEQNRTMAGEVAAAFDAARASMESFLESDLSDLYAPPSSREGGASLTLLLDLDFARARKDFSAFVREAQKQIRLSADGSGIVSAARSALEQVRSLFSSAGLQLKVTLTGETAGGSSGASGSSRAGGGSLVNAVTAELSASAAAPQVYTHTASSVQAPVNITVQASGSDPEAVGQSIYNTAERYLLRTLQSAQG